MKTRTELPYKIYEHCRNKDLKEILEKCINIKIEKFERNQQEKVYAKMVIIFYFDCLLFEN